MIISLTIIVLSCTKESEVIDEQTNIVTQPDNNIVLKNGNQNIHLYARYGDTGYSKMIVKKKDESLVEIKVIDKQHMPPDAAYSITALGLPIDTIKQIIEIPDDGKQYWIVSFNLFAGDKDVVTKVQQGDGGITLISYKCNCNGSVIPNIPSCEEHLDSRTGTISCTSLWGCNGICEMKSAGNSSTISAKSFLIICGDTIDYNGVIYN